METYIAHAPEALILPLLIALSSIIYKKMWVLLLALCILLLMLWFYRGHSGKFRKDASVFASPCDGTILNIQEDANHVSISVFLNIHNIHVQYAPMDGRIASITHIPGQFAPAYMFEKSQYNERVETMLETSIGTVGICQIAGQIARRIVSFHEPGAWVRRGQALGLIKFGSRVDIRIPRQCIQSVLVKQGQRVRIGTPLATLV